jgi:hypothetical protein
MCQGKGFRAVFFLNWVHILWVITAVSLILERSFFNANCAFTIRLYARILQLLNVPEVLGWWLVGYIYRVMPEAE